MELTLARLRAGRTGHMRLVPNINRSGRSLPDTPTAQDVAGAPLDNERRTRRLDDKQLYTLTFAASAAEWAAHPRLTLEVAFDPALYRMFNPSGLPLPNLSGGGAERSAWLPTVRRDLLQDRATQTKGVGVQYLVEAQTFIGSPLLEDPPRASIAFRVVDEAGQVIHAQTTFNGADIRPADVILLGDDAPAQRVFICDVGDNGPSIVEFADGAKAAGVPLTVIPLELNHGDSWIQDQFQIGYAATPEAQHTVVLHLPRVANDSAIYAGTRNLRTLVDGYLAADDVALVKDFWKLQVTLEGGIVDGSPTTLTFDMASGYLFYKQLHVLLRTYQRLFNLLREADARSSITAPSMDDPYALRMAIDPLYAQCLTYKTAEPEVRDRIAGAKSAIDQLATAFEVKGSTIVMSVIASTSSAPLEVKPVTVSIDRGSASALANTAKALNDLHSPSNYGGNVEVSPPTDDAPYGTILTGDVTSKELQSFLTSRGTLHPWVSASTGWLEVGHIDEIAAFAQRPGGGFALLRASPRVALGMLRALVELQGQGVLVTRLLRGKTWVHTSALDATDPMLPARAYVNLVRRGPYDLAAFKQPVPKTPNPPWGAAAYHDDRRFMVLNDRANVDARYAAMITCRDALAQCEGVNRTIEDLLLARSYAAADELGYRRYLDDDSFKTKFFDRRLEQVMAERFPGVPVYPLPALFDRTQNLGAATTSAFMPGMVNFQTLGKHVMVPKPHGPRMRVGDAVAFVNRMAARFDIPRVTLDERWVRSRALDRTWHWTRATERVTRADLANLPTDFDAEYEAWKQSRARADLNAALSGTVLDMIAHEPYFDWYAIEHRNDPLKNHPVTEPQTLRHIACCFKDGFDAFKNVAVDYCNGDTETAHPKSDQFDRDIQGVMDAIAKANPNAFDAQGAITSKHWIRIAIPEDTCDVFEVYTQLLMESLGLVVHWVDSWYYHTHKGGIHCGTNALRTRTSV